MSSTAEQTGSSDAGLLVIAVDSELGSAGGV